MTEHVELSVPATPAHLYLVRMHVGAIAARGGMDIGEVEDLRLAVDELCLSVLDAVGTPSGRLHVTTVTRDDGLEVRCRRTGSSSPVEVRAHGAGLPTSLSMHILDALVDAHGTTTEDGDRIAWLIKHWLPARSDP
jgi:anti-sigma regulatory factor (Ser/Thr protein kinase)